ncbi:hypothetical protein U1Q18_040799 [Sarracenia purpurea var. burkii]
MGSKGFNPCGFTSIEARILRIKGLCPVLGKATNPVSEASRNGGTRGDVSGKPSGVSSPLCEGDNTRSKVLKLKSTRSESTKEKGLGEQRFVVTPPRSHSEMEGSVEDENLGKFVAGDIANLGFPSLPLPVVGSVKAEAEAEATLSSPQI